ncbi:MAG: HvfC/BufC N-terminal domain-containing protein, partial [Terriglobales bacterium]
MNLDQIQRMMFNAVRQPLTPGERMRAKSLDGRSMNATAKSIIKPNERLTSFERLEIYNRQYWFRLISSMADDFDGLRAILGEKQFQKLVIAYLVDCPSTTFTLRNLGSRLEQWLSAHLEYVPGMEDISLDMVKLEWAEVEAFDSEARPKVSAEDLAKLGPDPLLTLQPYLRLLELNYPIHDLLLRLRERRRHDNRIRRISSKFLPTPQKTYIAVHRLDNSVYFKEVEPEAFAMLRALQKGCTVSEALE